MTRTVNGFIALRPIPGCRGAASCRPPRSWPLGRRSGRVPALPYPPPRLIQCTTDITYAANEGLNAKIEIINNRLLSPQSGASEDGQILSPRRSQTSPGPGLEKSLIFPGLLSHLWTSVHFFSPTRKSDQPFPLMRRQSDEVRRSVRSKEIGGIAVVS